jgi:hypothetical protein
LAPESERKARCAHSNPADGHAIACWVVETDAPDPNWSATRFWFAKDTQVMIREESTQKDGAVFVKTLLPYDRGDERSWNRPIP